MSPEVQQRVREIMNEKGCSFSEACGILGKHAAAKKAARRRRIIRPSTPDKTYWWQNY